MAFTVFVFLTSLNADLGSEETSCLTFPSALTLTSFAVGPVSCFAPPPQANRRRWRGCSRYRNDPPSRQPSSPSPASTASAAVTAARAAIQADHPAAQALMPLAALLSISPFRLSRAFSNEMGVSLTRYRNHVRLKRVLDRLEEGEDNLAVLAADLQFADQAHLCRTVRQHLGHTPTALRRLLNCSPSD